MGSPRSLPTTTSRSFTNRASRPTTYAGKPICSGTPWARGSFAVSSRVMLVAVVGRVHGSAAALEAVLQAANAVAARRIIVIGDVIESGFDDEVVRTRLARTPGVEWRPGTDHVREILVRGERHVLELT